MVFKQSENDTVGKCLYDCNHLCGNDKNGKQYSFDINKKRYRSENNLLEETEQTVTVTYLPHTEIILDIEYKI